MKDVSAGALRPGVSGEEQDPKATAADLVRPGQWKRTFTSLAERDYRWYFAGNIAFFMAMQMNLIIRGYLAYKLTDSATALAIISLTVALPMLIIAPIGGVASDWFNKRTLLILAQSFVAVVNLVVTILVLTGAIAFWHLMVAAVLTGSVMSIVMPAREAVVAQLIPQHKLMNAISLQMSGQNLTRVIGPGLGTALIALFGVGSSYGATVALFTIGVLCMLPVPSAGMSSREGDESPKEFRKDLAGGFKYVAGNPTFRVLLMTALVMPLFAFPVMQLLPVVAKDVFSSPDIGLGVLAVAGGVGGLIGSLASASFDNFERKGFLMLIGSLIMAICFIAFAVSPVLVVAAVVLAAGNVGQMIFMTTNNTVIQATVPDEFRGRVMSMLMMSFGISPLGVLPVAVAADTLGVQWAIGLSAVVFLVLVIVVFSVNKRLRNLALSQFEEAELSPAQAAQLVAEGKITREEAARLTGRAQPATGG